MIKTRLKKNDTVVVAQGSDKGKRGKIQLIDIKRGRVIVEGVNMKKKYLRRTQENPKGGQIELAYSISISNVMIFCDKCKKAVRIGINVDGDSRTRVCRKCGKRID